MGGICDAIALTINILLFPKLGSVQTTVMPVLGMTLMSMIIDHYAWFNSIQYYFGLSRGVGVLLVLVGVFLAIAVQDTPPQVSQATLISFFVGMIILIMTVGGGDRSYINVKNPISSQLLGGYGLAVY